MTVACPVVEVEAIPLVTSAAFGDLDASRETIVVRVVDADGRVGVGEADAPAQVVRELVQMDDLFSWSRGLRSIVVGRDPFELQATQAAMLDGTIYHGRRGLGVHAVSAVDIALHDLVGKQLGRPAYQLLGGARRTAVVPYATIWPGTPRGRSIREVMDAIGVLFERAIALGFGAVKMEVVFEDAVDDRGLVDCIREGRRRLGSEPALLLDFGYRWHHWRDAAWVLDRIEDCDVFLAEATLQHDDMDGHARLASRVRTRVAGGEFAATVQECREWIERGRVDVLQPDVNRCGGLTELRRIAELAGHHGVEVVPHGWKTGITAAAARHFQAATPNAPYVEMYHAELFHSTLRSELTGPDPTIHDGVIDLPTAPGLGIEVDDDVVTRFRTDVRA
ncbi:MAG: L-alanine-DL-glutamate epimerase (EC [uncultured Thermoleophilia bacterium]|uniref:L-alanine-DL-glutamate epimerase (EC) n=1 Tax=uncultured Thermoleophilia bacterium TaxID=1497501 RepID=A0A6J4UNK0_9ACTN|nr:MAG: L-alanine-DL-glutamate epimerase (EC [uncultured Thermoleophilia bacterium]